MTTTTMAIDAFTERTAAAERVVASLGGQVHSARLISSESSGDSFVTGYVVETTDPSGTLREHTVYLDTGLDDAPGTVRLTDSTGRSLRAWIYPADPALPALASVVYPESAARILTHLGLAPTAVDLSVCTYRPGKRAVVRVETPESALYVKIVRPERSASIAATHRSWTAADIPVARLVAWSPDGMLAMEPLRGIEAISVVGSGGDVSRLVERVRDLTRRIAGAASDHPARPSLANRLDPTRTGMVRLAPGCISSIDTLCTRIRTTLDRLGPVPLPVTIHGDLHLGQIFLDPDEPGLITGVVDIDTAGLGDPADDAAALVAQLLASAELMEHGGYPDRAVAARRAARRFRDAWGWPDDPGFAERASAITATHLLGHALSGSLDPDTAIRLAHAWLP
jgi:hypothetical protein